MISRVSKCATFAGCQHFELTQALELYWFYQIRLPSATGRLKPSWSGLRTAATVILQRRSPVGDAAKETRHASTFGRTRTG